MDLFAASYESQLPQLQCSYCFHSAFYCQSLASHDLKWLQLWVVGTTCNDTSIAHRYSSYWW